MDEPLSDETMSSLVTEFKKACQPYAHRPEQGGRVSSSFPRMYFFSFLEECQLQIKPDDDGINTKVRAIFTSTQVHANYTTCTPDTASTVRCILYDADIPGCEDDEEEEPSANKELSDWLVAAREHLRTVQSSSRAHADETTEEPGLILAKSIDDVMTQLDSAIDVSKCTQFLLCPGHTHWE
ncbi:hypothetical protein FVER53590_09683 [Fusarium verticillioides]|nr:hypothetical protein FVER53590_09683 [Fusarium verticillioides]